MSGEMRFFETKFSRIFGCSKCVTTTCGIPIPGSAWIGFKSAWWRRSEVSWWIAAEKRWRRCTAAAFSDENRIFFFTCEGETYHTSIIGEQPSRAFRAGRAGHQRQSCRSDRPNVKCSRFASPLDIAQHWRLRLTFECSHIQHGYSEPLACTLLFLRCYFCHRRAHLHHPRFLCSIPPRRPHGRREPATSVQRTRAVPVVQVARPVPLTNTAAIANWTRESPHSLAFTQDARKCWIRPRDGRLSALPDVGGSAVAKSPACNAR